MNKLLAFALLAAGCAGAPATPAPPAASPPELIALRHFFAHGAKDTRVNVRESEQMVAALKQAGKDVRYVVFPDEGHSRDYGNWRNALRHYAEVEEFLARCLGGRRSG
jgi:predicted esterase